MSQRSYPAEEPKKCQEGEDISNIVNMNSRSADQVLPQPGYSLVDVARFASITTVSEEKKLEHWDTWMDLL